MESTQTEESTFNKKPLVAVMLVGAFIAILNQTLLTTALPHLMVDLQINENKAQWVTTIFMLVNGIMIPISAFLIEKFRTRFLFLTAMSLFGIGTLIALLLLHLLFLWVAASFKQQEQAL